MIYWEITAGFANSNTLICKHTAEQAWRVAARLAELIYFLFPDLTCHHLGLQRLWMKARWMKARLVLSLTGVQLVTITRFSDPSSSQTTSSFHSAPAA